ncbi:MAG: ABC transporter substrate-binding protein [Synergistaceae bacterium]|nr:ABC transporter substrate-binding protein [Synergistaceae bacterium]
MKNKNGVWIGLVILIIIIGFVITRDKPSPVTQEPAETVLEVVSSDAETENAAEPGTSDDAVPEAEAPSFHIETPEKYPTNIDAPAAETEIAPASVSPDAPAAEPAFGTSSAETENAAEPGTSGDAVPEAPSFHIETPEKYPTDIGAPAAETEIAPASVSPDAPAAEPAFGTSSDVSAAPETAAPSPIKIGEIATVTGDFAAYGVAEVESVKIAVKEINDAGGVLGRPLEVTMYDCRTRNEDMVNAARRLAQQDKVSAVIGPSGSGLCIAASPIFNQGRVPHIGTLPTNPLVTVDESGNVKPFNFRICFLDPYQGRILATFASRNLGAKTAAVLYDVASDYSQGLREFFVQDFTAGGGTIVADEGHRSDDVDFRAQLTKIKDANPDVLILPTMGKVLPLSVKQAREAGIDIPIIGGDGYGDFMWEVAGADAMKNTFWVSHVDKADPALADFFRKYEESTGTECQEFMNAVMAYDSVYWLKDAIERAGGDDPEKIRDALESTENLKLTHSVITMDEFHNPKGKDGVILEAKDGKAVYLVTIRPEM